MDIIASKDDLERPGSDFWEWINSVEDHIPGIISHGELLTHAVMYYKESFDDETYAGVILEDHLLYFRYHYL